MSRLESFIRRMQAQKACLDLACREIAERPGPVLEIGFGNGRTYDHLRQRCPGRAIYVFDRRISAHPDCVPSPELTRLGDFRRSLTDFATEGIAPAVLIHADIGTGDEAESQRLAAALAPILARLLGPSGLLAADQLMDAAGLEPLPLPEGVEPGRYCLYRRLDPSQLPLR